MTTFPIPTNILIAHDDFCLGRPLGSVDIFVRIVSISRMLLDVLWNTPGSRLVIVEI